MWPESEEPKVLAMQKPTIAEPIDYSAIVMTISAWASILNARLLALLSLLGTLGGFGFCMYDPAPQRLYGLAIYAILCQMPILGLYMRKG